MWLMTGAAMLAASGCSPDSPDLTGHLLLTTEQQSALKTLNEYGSQSVFDASFQFSLDNACNLHVTALLSGSRSGQFSVSLRSTEFERFALAKGLGTSIRVASDPAHPTIFTARSADTLDKVVDVLKQLQSECR